MVVLIVSCFIHFNNLSQKDNFLHIQVPHITQNFCCLIFRFCTQCISPLLSLVDIFIYSSIITINLLDMVTKCPSQHIIYVNSSLTIILTTEKKDKKSQKQVLFIFK